MQTDYERWEPLHWIIEFPDVMIEHGGFDAVIGNPPFLGGKKISPAMGQNLRLWLVNQLAGGTSGNADLVAYFFLRAASLLADKRGQLGLIATNTIAQGDTREVGLDRLVVHGFTLRRTIRSATWPARGANLEYAAIWATQGELAAGTQRVADGVIVPAISTLLEAEGRVKGQPSRLAENVRVAFQGSIILGRGFVLTPMRAKELIARDERNSEVVLPYLNGEDLNGRPDSSASRWVIDFKERTEEEARSYREPWEIVEGSVRGQRITKDATRYPRMVNEWWKYWNARPGLYGAIREFDRVLAIAQVSRTLMPVAVPTGQVLDAKLIVFALTPGSGAVLFSSLHQAWAIKYGTTMRTDATYTPSSIFETFARPASGPTLEAAGETLEARRRAVMLRRSVGLTKLYNLINDRDCLSEPDINSLRDIHVALDHAVLDAYGWSDVPLNHGFHAYRGVERFTIDPAARVELLDRLLEENHRRAVSQSGDAEMDIEDSDELDLEGMGE